MKAVIKGDRLDRATRRVVVVFDRLPLGRKGVLLLFPGELRCAALCCTLIMIKVDELGFAIVKERGGVETRHSDLDVARRGLAKYR